MRKLPRAIFYQIFPSFLVFGHIIKHTSYEDFFPDVTDYHNIENQYSRQDIVNVDYNSVYIHNCIFKELSTDQKGGAIHFNRGGKLAIENCLFYRCHAYGERGGAINIDQGDVALASICSNDCWLDSSNSPKGSFIYVSAPCQMSFTTAGKCGGEYSECAIYLARASKLEHSNVSNSYMKKVSGVFLSTSVTIKMSTFEGNYVIDNTVMHFKTGITSKFCNFIDNNQGGSDNGIYFIDAGGVVFDNCIFAQSSYQNDNTQMFKFGQAATFTQCFIPNNCRYTGNSLNNQDPRDDAATIPIWFWYTGQYCGTKNPPPRPTAPPISQKTNTTISQKAYHLKSGTLRKEEIMLFYR